MNGSRPATIVTGRLFRHWARLGWAPLPPASGVHADEVLVGEGLEGPLGVLAAVTGTVDAPEGVFGAGLHVPVDQRHAGIDLRRERLPLLEVIGPHRTHQTVFGVVGQAQSVLFVLGPVDHDGGTEEL